MTMGAHAYEGPISLTTGTTLAKSWIRLCHCPLSTVLPPPHTDAFFMRCAAIRHYASMHIRGRISQ